MLDNKIKAVGSKEFAYIKGRRVTDKQKYFIDIIEIAVPGIRFMGHNSKDAYEFISKFKNYVEYDRRTGDVYSLLGGKKEIKGSYFPTVK